MSKMMLSTKISPAPIPTGFIASPPGAPPAPLPPPVITQTAATLSAFVSASKDGGVAPHTASSVIPPVGLPFQGNLLAGPAQTDYVLPLQVNSLVVSCRKPVSKKVAKLPIGAALVQAKKPSFPPVPDITFFPLPIVPYVVPPLLASLFVINVRK